MTIFELKSYSFVGDAAAFALVGFYYFLRVAERASAGRRLSKFDSLTELNLLNRIAVCED